MQLQLQPRQQHPLLAQQLPQPWSPRSKLPPLLLLRLLLHQRPCKQVVQLLSTDQTAPAALAVQPRALLLYCRLPLQRQLAPLYQRAGSLLSGFRWQDLGVPVQ
jgi:hypothetical protein